MACTKKRINKVKYCAGDLRHRGKFKNITLDTPTNGIDFDKTFNNERTAWMGVQTKKGTVFFEDINQDRDTTHLIVARFDKSVTAQTWIELNGKNFDILQVTNVNEDNIWMEMKCNVRGKTDKKSSRF